MTADDRGAMEQEAVRNLPRASRPRFPDGYGAPQDEYDLLPWSHIVDRMSKAHNIWVCTVEPTGLPHVVPVWGVWADDILYFHVAPTSRTGRNLAVNPAVAIHLPSGDDVVILKGYVESVDNRSLGPTRAAAVAAASREQYPEAFEGAEPWEYRPDEGVAFALRITLAYAWTNIAVDPTRWHFAGA